MAYIEREKVLEIVKDEYYSDFHKSMADLTSLRELLEDTPAADVVEVKDCEQCIHSGKHATEYPCSYCRNCYTDKFQPNNTRTPKERGGEK